MELYLDSADINEIKEASQLGFLTGLTTTPTFMHRHGVKDVDTLILELSKIVKILQIEALGNTSAEIVEEAERLRKLGLNPEKTVFKIPVSLEGVKACYELRKKKYLVNIHLVYTVQQAYIAMQAGATYVCPLIGRLQDEGHNALYLAKRGVEIAKEYNYDTIIMFSSVRNLEHVRNALDVGVSTITLPWKILKQLTEHNFTKIGINQCTEHHNLMTKRVADIISKIKPIVSSKETLKNSIVKMTEVGFGCVIVIDEYDNLLGLFTDGDLRRLLQSEGHGILNQTMAEIKYNNPITIDYNALLNDAIKLLKEHSIDNLLVVKDKKPVGILDIQDIELN
ncbi:MAG: transaldolase family protein [Solitalea-like symbiont of Acarus siro]